MSRAILTGPIALALSALLAGASGPGVANSAHTPQERAPASIDLATAVTDVETGRLNTPVVGTPMPDGDVPVTFLAKRSRGRAPRIVSDVTGWGERLDGTFDAKAGTMTRIGRTEWYSLDVRVAPRARIEYQIAYGVGDNEVDPHNPRRVGPPPASEFVTPGYVPPAALADAGAPLAGTLRDQAIPSRALGGTQQVAVYVPRGATQGPRPLAVFLDNRAREMSQVIDWLVAHDQVDPFVAAFVRLEAPGDRTASSEAFRTFLVEELPAWLTTHDGATTVAAERAILAISFGAKDALQIALGAPGGYGRLGLLIPGRRITPSDMAAVRATRGVPLRVSILAGRYDRSNVDTARGLRDALLGAGHLVSYTEVPEGHSPRTWLNHLGDVLTELLPPRPGSATGPTGANSGGSDARLRERAQALDGRFAAARSACDGRWQTDAACLATLKRLRDEELGLFADVRAHEFSNITESNYWHRGRLKFPSEIAQLVERLGLQ